jgi:AraC-like DNA-binding protein
MVCNRCISVVSGELQSLGIPIVRVILGEVELEKSLSGDERNSVMRALEKHGFELLDDRKSKIAEQIKTLLIVLVHHRQDEKPEHMRYSDYLERQVGMDYSSLSKLFSEAEGVTIEHYLINQKVEHVKELLIYDELTVSEIAAQMNYSSVAHLSAQFKKITGLTPSDFKKLHNKKRKPLDEV